jgi:3-hydroxyacyl-CoA dehydrogenase
MPHIAKSLLNTLPNTDDYARIFRSEALIEKMIQDGYTGRKGKGGFYRLNNEGGKREKESISLKTGEYGKSGKAALESAEAGKKGLRAVLEHSDKGGQYAKAVMVPVFGYVAGLVPEIAADIASVDAAMRWGYNWKHGPFEMMDAVGADWLIGALKEQGRPVPEFLAKAAGKSFYKVENGKRYQLMPSGDYAELKPRDGVLLLSDIKRAAAPVAKNGSASLWDIGDGVLCVEFTSKMNAIDTDIFAMEKKAMDLVKSGKFKAIVIYNEGENFSVGANLGLAVFAINIGLFPTIEQLVSEGQETYKALKFAPFPVVAAPSGMALGGGCEVLLHVAHVQAHAETYCGLVEVGVGLIPGWGGCKEMLLRSRGKGGGPMPAVGAAFETIGTAKVAKSAFEAKELGYFRKADGVTMNRDRLLFDAKQKALELAKDYKAPEPETLRLPGAGGKAALQLALDTLYLAGKATPYDMVVSDALADVLSGGKKDMLDDVSEDDVLELERTAFMKLVKNEGTIARIEHMLANGKPLRN